MNNLDRYDRIFSSCLGVSKDQLKEISFHSVQNWDSIGHIKLIAALEEEFNVMLDPENITKFSSYEKGKEILRNLNVNI